MVSHDLTGMGRNSALEILKMVYVNQPDEREEEYKKRMDLKFDEIEPNCGLLKQEKGQHYFWHLTFQEFLAALYLMNKSTDYCEAIKDYWNMDRYKEVLEILIGLLSMKNMEWVNLILSKNIGSADTSPFKKWLAASKALVDMEEEKRDDALLKKVKEKLLAITNSREAHDLLLKAGENFGWLGNPRDLKCFIEIQGGKYSFGKRGDFDMKPFEISKYPVTNALKKGSLPGGTSGTVMNATMTKQR